MKQVKCADLGNDCDFVAKGSVEEVMLKLQTMLLVFTK